MSWIFIVGLVALVIIAPFVRERLRRPVARDRDKAESASNFALLSDGITHYQWHGNATTSVMVLIHGLTTPSWVFAGLIRGLNMMGYHVLTYDLYGRGLSDRPTNSQSPQFFLHQLTELLEEQGLEGPVSIIGYSMGGVIGSLFAATHPDRVDRLILLAPAGIDYAPGPLLRRAGDLGALGSWLWHIGGARVLSSAARRDAAGPTVIPDMGTRMEAETGRRGYLRGVLSAHRHALSVPLEDIHRDVGKTEIPVLAVWGQEDAVIPPTAMGKLTQWNRRARHHVVKGAGHSLPHTAPNEIIAAITSFLREV